MGKKSCWSSFVEGVAMYILLLPEESQVDIE
jgi:hypothetical protein